LTGLTELLNQNQENQDGEQKKKSVKAINVKKNSTGNAFLERVEQYKKQKLEKEKQREELRKKIEEDKIKETCTFQPKTIS
jgi:nucleosome binding factor SPN SPT16 subunit